MKDGLSISRAAERYPDCLAVVTADREWTFREVLGESARAARFLNARFPGICPGDRLPLLGVASLEALWITYAALDGGLCLVPVHDRWTAGERRSYLDALDLGEELDPSALGAPGPFAGPLPEFFAEGEPAVGPESPAAILPTSGSTGPAKGVVLSRRAFLASAAADRRHFSRTGDGRALLGLPLAHVGGLSIVTRALSGGSAVVLPPPADRFDPAAVGEQIARFRVTRLSVVPTMLRRLLAAGIRPAPCLRTVLVGGAAAPERLLAEARRAGWPVLPTYGLTEACSQVATEVPGVLREDTSRGGAAPAGIGPLLPGIEGRIVDGVLEIAGPTLMSGYVPSPEPGRGLLAGGRLRTGDLARFDEEGRLHILGRADDVIVTGGENVSPLEVETALEEHPAVSAAWVYGVEDPEWGQAVRARVLPDPRQEAPDPEVLGDFLRARLARFKIPRRIEIVDSLKRTASGKVDRSAPGRT